MGWETEYLVQEMLDEARTKIRRLEREIKDLSAERVALQENERTLTCVYCGHQYPPGTPESNHHLLTQHIAECEKHPMSKLKKENEKLGKIILDLNEKLHEKNLELDALHWVWCDGGCGGGVHRYDHGELTEEIVRMVEGHAKRLRRWWTNKTYTQQSRDYPFLAHIREAIRILKTTKRKLL